MERKRNMDAEDERKLKELIQERFPEHILVNIKEYENAEHQTFKYLYEDLFEQNSNLQREFQCAQHELQNAERKIMELEEKLEGQKDINCKLKDSTGTVMDFIKEFVDKDIVVSDIKLTDSLENEIQSTPKPKVYEISLEPGIYSFHRASWFTPLRTELNKSNIGKRNAERSCGILKERLHFMTALFSRLGKKEISSQEAAEEIDNKRLAMVQEIIESNDTNEIKYIKYFLLTPGMPKDYMKTLNGAEELGLDASVIIGLLEQPREFFNKELIEAYVSKVHKATEYNLKRELAEELIRGEWYINSNINGHPQRFQLVPFEMISEMREKLNNICNVLLDNEKKETDVDDGEEEFVPTWHKDESGKMPEKFKEDFEDIPEELIDFMEQDLSELY